MSQICQRIEETLVCGQALTKAQSLHIAGCNSCGATQRTSVSLKTTLESMAEPAAPLGFATRLEATVHSRIHNNAVFRPRYLALAVGGALASAAALILLLRSTGPTNHQEPAVPNGAVLQASTTQASTQQDPARLPGSASGPDDAPGSASAPDDAPGSASGPDDASAGGNALDDTDWAQLVVLADVDASLQTSAKWDEFLEPIAATEVFELERKE